MILSLLPCLLAVLAPSQGQTSVASLRGTLRDASGKPVTLPARVQVAMRKDDGSYQQPEVKTSDGSWKLETEPGWKVIEIWARARGMGQGHAFLERVLAAGENAALDLVVPAGAALSGVVVDKLSGKPLPGARVWAESWQWDEEGFTPLARVDAEGRFTLQGLTETPRTGRDGQTQPGFDVRAEAGDFAPLQPDTPTFTRVGPGRFETRLELVPNNCEVQGVVNLAEDGSPCDGAMVALIDSLGQYRATTTQAGGSFSFDHVGAGKAWLWSWPITALTAANLGAHFGRETCEVGIGSNAAVIWLEPIVGTAISGTLEVAENARDLKVKVRLRRGLMRERVTVYFEEREVELDEQGRFTCVDALPGHYQVDVAFPPDGPQGLVSGGNQELDLELGKNPPPVKLGCALPVTFTGSVPDKLPEGLFPLVEYVQADQGNWTGVPLEAGQRFTLAGFWPGRWKLRLRWGANLGPEIVVGPGSERELVLRARP